MTSRLAFLAQLAATPLLLWTGACQTTNSCIAAGSRVATPAGWLTIERLQPGDSIYAVDLATGALVATVVTLVRRSHRECVALVSAGGHSLCVTPDHPVYAPQHAGFVVAGRFVLGQTTRVLIVDLPGPDARAEVSEIGACSTYAGLHPVYDLSVAGAHPTFIAEGFVVHNKSYDPSSTSDVDIGPSTSSATTAPTTDGNTGTSDASMTITGGSATTDGNTGITENCEPILNQAGLETGFESCDDGSKRRYAAITCPTEETSEMSPCGPDPAADCMVDVECIDQPHGYCAQAHKLTGYCGCFYGCQSDADCTAGSICECGVVVGHCVPATCTTNEDCDPGLGCVATVNGTAGPGCTDVGAGEPASYACQAAADECHGDLECPAEGSNNGACLLVGDHRVCGTICGMPP